MPDQFMQRCPVCSGIGAYGDSMESRCWLCDGHGEVTIWVAAEYDVAEASFPGANAELD